MSKKGVDESLFWREGEEEKEVEWTEFGSNELFSARQKEGKTKAAGKKKGDLEGEKPEKKADDEQDESPVSAFAGMDASPVEMAEEQNEAAALTQAVATDSHTPTADEEAPQEAGASANEDLPVASKVEPPKELLDRIRSLEEAENERLNATPVDVEEEKRQARKRRWILGIIVMGGLVILGVVLGVTFGTLAKSPPPPIAASGGFVPTPAPTTEKFAALQDLIAFAALDGGASLSDPLSAQYKALTWLEGNENLNDYPDWRKIQRHTLATFYFSTNGDDWIERDFWLTDEDECNWFTSAVDPPCDEGGVFTRLALFENNVAGTLPKDLAILSDSMRKSSDWRNLLSCT